MKRNAYHRADMRERRSGTGDAPTLPAGVKYESLDDLLRCLQRSIESVEKAPVEVLIKARTLARLIDSTVKLHEAARIEARLKKLEDLAAGAVGGNNGKPMLKAVK